MESIGWMNAFLIASAVISFALGFVNKIDEYTRLILFLASSTILAIACLFIFLKSEAPTPIVCLIANPLQRSGASYSEFNAYQPPASLPQCTKVSFYQPIDNHYKMFRGFF